MPFALGLFTIIAYVMWGALKSPARLVWSDLTLIDKLIDWLVGPRGHRMHNRYVVSHGFGCATLKWLADEEPDIIANRTYMHVC